MNKYCFLSELTAAEISRKILLLPRVGLPSMTKTGCFSGEVRKRKISIGYTPDKLTSTFSFFCGVIEDCPTGTKITGKFTPPIKLVIGGYLAFCLFALCVGNVRGLVWGVVGCAFLQLLQNVFLSINTSSKKRIISFVESELSSKILP